MGPAMVVLDDTLWVVGGLDTEATATSPHGDFVGVVERFDEAAGE